MFVVIKLGGCNGSGKTTLARELLKLVTPKPATFSGAAKSPNMYRGEYADAEVVVLGSYETKCGGMDTISDKLQRLALLGASRKPGRIIFYEGLITGKTYGAMGAVSEQDAAKGNPWLYAFMDTPWAVCVQRVLLRRAEAGNANSFDPERTMRPTFDSCAKLAAKLRQEVEGRDGPLFPHPVHMIKHDKKPAAEAKRLLNAALKLGGWS